MILRNKSEKKSNKEAKEKAYIKSLKIQNVKFMNKKMEISPSKLITTEEYKHYL